LKQKPNQSDVEFAVQLNEHYDRHEKIKKPLDSDLMTAIFQSNCAYKDTFKFIQQFADDKDRNREVALWTDLLQLTLKREMSTLDDTTRELRDDEDSEDGTHFSDSTFLPFQTVL